jgi:hypothetical protein
MLYTTENTLLLVFKDNVFRVFDKIDWWNIMKLKQ